MANQPEVGTYDAGVYQIETTDPVQGGVGGLDNAPLLNLANRTGWLKNQITSILSTIATLAGLNSPNFTGSPTVPDVAAGDQSTLIANTDFVSAAIGGEVNVVTTGGTTTLTQSQWGVAVLNITGTLTSNATIIFPARHDRWIVLNTTSGHYTVTCKTASGGGVTVTQGYSQELLCDATNILPVMTDFQRIRLTANLNVYVSTTGSDSNDGLSSGTALATLQAAWSLLFSRYDFAGTYTATINIADGTYTAGLNAYGTPLGYKPGAPVNIVGDTTTPSNVLINVTSGNCFAGFLGSFVSLNGLKMQATGVAGGYSSIGFGISAGSGANFNIQNLDFGACGTAHMQMYGVGSSIQIPAASTAYKISGSAQYHVYASVGGLVQTAQAVVTITGTPAFTAFAAVSAGAEYQCYGMTVTGSATGARYSITTGATINTNGAGANYLPGSSAGTNTSGYYV